MKLIALIAGATLVIALVAWLALRATEPDASGPVKADLDTFSALGPDQRADIVPIVRPLGDEAFGRADARRRQDIHPVPPETLRAMFDGKPVPAEDLPVMDLFVGNLSIRYAVDGQSITMNVAPRMLEKLGVSRDELLTTAVANLHRRYPDAEIHRNGRMGMVTGAGDLESSWLLDFAFWTEEAKRFDGTLVASVPARDVMVWCDSSDAALLAQLRETGAQVHAKELPNNRAVSTLLYAWRDGHWEVYEP